MKFLHLENTLGPSAPARRRPRPTQSHSPRVELPLAGPARCPPDLSPPADEGGSERAFDACPRPPASTPASVGSTHTPQRSAGQGQARGGPQHTAIPGQGHAPAAASRQLWPHGGSAVTCKQQEGPQSNNPDRQCHCRPTEWVTHAPSTPSVTH